MSDDVPKGFALPNYTQTPNALFDLMPQMNNQELRVTLAIIRKTKGWHKQEDELSISQLMELTGLSRQGVVNGTRRALERGTVYRKPAGRSFVYGLIVNVVDQAKEDVSTSLTNDSQRRLPKSVNDVDTQKKGKKEKEIQDAPSKNEVKREPNKAELDAMFEALAAGSFGVTDMSLVGKLGGRIGKLRTWIVETFPHHRALHIKAFYAWWRAEYDTTDAPRDPDKFSEHYLRFVQLRRQGKDKPVRAKPTVIEFPDVDEDERKRLAELAATSKPAVLGATGD